MPGLVKLRRRGRSRAESASLHANSLAVPSLTPRVAARAQAWLFLTAGSVGALGVVLPHPERFDEAAMLSVQIGSIAMSILLFTAPQVVPRWALAMGPYGAAALTSVAVVSSGDATSAYVLFYLWVALYAFYYLSAVGAAALAVFTIANYAAVLAWFDAAGGHETAGDNREVSLMVLTTGTIVVAGAFILMLRDRVGGLIHQLTEAATTDHLTGLLNRRGFQQAIDAEISRSARNGGPFSLLLGDCDFFKSLNDSLGHQAGDHALVLIGQMLEADKRRPDIAARVGGEEFALVLPETDHHQAFITAERIRTKLAATFAGQAIPLTMSFGVATYPTHGVTTDALLSAADDALYAAKTLGRDRTVLHSAEIEDILATRSGSDQSREQANLATVLNLAQALDMRDSGTARHSQTVGRYCEMMGHQLGLGRERVERLRLAGLLHDIGKIGVRDSILSKPGALTDEEFEVMRKHPEIGARILSGSGLDDIQRWVLAHHERPDGRGYPHGLSNDDIELEAKIVAVADAYEAMTCDRVYRKSIGAKAAREELLACSGTQFDPTVVAAFLAVLKRSSDAEPELAASF